MLVDPETFVREAVLLCLEEKNLHAEIGIQFNAILEANLIITMKDWFSLSTESKNGLKLPQILVDWLNEVKFVSSISVPSVNSTLDIEGKDKLEKALLAWKNSSPVLRATCEYTVRSPTVVACIPCNSELTMKRSGDIVRYKEHVMGKKGTVISRHFKNVKIAAKSANKMEIIKEALLEPNYGDASLDRIGLEIIRDFAKSPRQSELENERKSKVSKSNILCDCNVPRVVYWVTETANRFYGKLWGKCAISRCEYLCAVPRPLESEVPENDNPLQL
jgi:hypothetical protein